MASVKDSRTQPSLYTRFSIGSTWELTLVNDEKVVGDVYCTDPLSDVVVLQDQLNDIRIVSVGSIKDSSQLKESTAKQPVGVNMTHTKKVLEEREKRAIRIAQESLRHLNPKASPKGQIVFDRLLKACNEVIWKGESIIVMNQIRVDPPYSQSDCKLLQGGSTQQGGSMDRVQKIVAAASAS